MISNKNIILTCILLLVLSGCASVTPVVTQTKIIDRPSINEVNSEELGNTLLEYFMSNTQPSLKVLEQWGADKRHKIFAPQVLRPVGVGEKVNSYYVEEAPPGIADIFRFVCYDRSDKIFFMTNGYGICDLIYKSLSGSGPVNVIPADYVDNRSPQFKQELIYNGKIGNNIKFLYREISDNYMRAPFTQEIQYDLQEGNIIGFKGARIEIINSSNRLIEYKVLKTFER